MRADIAQRREAFQTDARIAHRVLSQRAVQHEAILATLVLLSDGRRAGRPEQRLPAVYPQVLAVLRRDGSDAWQNPGSAPAPDPLMQAAEQRSRALQHAVPGPVDAAARKFTLVLAGAPVSFALHIDVQRMVPWDEWPLAPDGPVRATLRIAGASMLLQPGEPARLQPTGLTDGFVFSKPLSAVSQPFELHLQRAAGPAEWPWRWLSAWAGLTGFALAGLAAGLRGRRAQRRAEALLRVGKIARLNALGELAGGMAHELNQPLAAVLANTQAAGRLLDDDPPQLASARDAMRQAAAQARRAADVVARLRRLVDTPGATAARQAVPLERTVRNVLNLFEPELRGRAIDLSFEGQAPPVLADPVALEQIVHNLIGNAMRALEDVPTGQRRLVLMVQAEPQPASSGQGVLTIQDSGPGIAPDALAHLFEPFNTTRSDGLGLGLSLCATLAQSMDGTLTAQSDTARGAVFRLALPLAPRQA